MLSNMRMSSRLALSYGLLFLLVTGVIAFCIANMDSLSPNFVRVGASLVELGVLVAILCILSIASLMQNISQPLADAIYIAETVASGELSKEFASGHRGDFGRLLNAVVNTEDTLTDLVTGIKQSTDTIAIASQQISSGNGDLSQRIEREAASLQETAAGMDRITVTVRQNAERARAANALATNASVVAAHGGAIVEQVVSSMESISIRTGNRQHH